MFIWTPCHKNAWEVEAWFLAFLALYGVKRSASRSGRFSPNMHYIGACVVSRSDLDAVEKIKCFLLLGFYPHISDRSFCTLVTVSTEQLPVPSRWCIRLQSTKCLLGSDIIFSALLPNILSKIKNNTKNIYWIESFNLCGHRIFWRKNWKITYS
jgi:hypothetical protein